MDNNKANKVKKIKLVTFIIVATFGILFLYKYLSKIEHDVSKENVFLVQSDKNDNNDENNENDEIIFDINVTNQSDLNNMNSGSKPSEDSLEHDLEDTDNSKENEEIEDEDIQTTLIMAPDLIGMDEATAISTCTQNGYTYSVEYYLGGNGTVISQSPMSSESIEPGGNVSINIGITQSDFSNKLLALINEKRRNSGLGDLSFSEQLNAACNILAQENVNSIDCTRPDGSHWSSVLWENGIWMNDGVFTTRNNITSLSDANGRIKYAGNSYGAGNLLTPSYTLIGMAYSANNMLVMIIGS